MHRARLSSIYVVFSSPDGQRSPTLFPNTNQTQTTHTNYGEKLRFLQRRVLESEPNGHTGGWMPRFQVAALGAPDRWANIRVWTP